MIFHEFGAEHKSIVIFIHGLLTPWQVLMPQAEYFSKDYHVIIPVIDGHNPNEKSEFISLDKTASDIIDFLDKRDKDIALICGMSMGGAVASIVAANGKFNTNQLVLESAPLIGQSKFVSALMIRQYLNLTRKAKQRDKKTLIQCEKTFIPKEYMMDFLDMIDTVSDATIVNAVHSVGKFRLPQLQRNYTYQNLVYVCGTSINELISKKSAKLLLRKNNDTNIVYKNNYSHCEMSLRYPNEFSAMIEGLL